MPITRQQIKCYFIFLECSVVHGGTRMDLYPGAPITGADDEYILD